jgi:hypothetical protein
MLITVAIFTLVLILIGIALHIVGVDWAIYIILFGFFIGAGYSLFAFILGIYRIIRDKLKD